MNSIPPRRKVSSAENVMSSTVRRPKGTQINDGMYTNCFVRDRTTTRAFPRSLRRSSNALVIPPKFPPRTRMVVTAFLPIEVHRRESASARAD
jgi:hypothetical protein